jgi:hypothetical protein
MFFYTALFWLHTLSDEQGLVPTGSLICMLRGPILAILFKETKSLSVFQETS